MEESGLHILGIEITSKCNKNCSHCYAYSENQDQQIPIQKIREILNEANEMNVKELIITGGEPLLYSHFKELTSLISEYPFKKFLETNGSLINNNNIDLLTRFSLVQISFDINALGFKGGLRDNSLEEIENAIDLLKGKVETHLYMTICQSNMAYIDLAISWAKKHNISIGFNIFSPIGRGRFLDKELLDQNSLKSIIQKLCNLYYEKKIPKPSHPLTIFYLEDKKNAALNANRIMGGCIAGIGSCFISPQGDVFPCAFLRVSSGNVYEKSLNEIWNNNVVFSQLRNRKLYKGQCRKCELICGCGGCRGRAFSLTGDYLSEDPSCFKGD